MTTLKQALERFIDETEIGFYGTATGKTATTVTDAANFQNANQTSGVYKNWWFHFPTATAANQVRAAGTLSTATLTTVGANTDTTELYYRLTRPDWHPTRYLLPLANRALELAWQWWRSPITMVPDGDMQASTAGSWTGGSSTLTKSTTRTWGNGVRSLRAANTAATGGAISTAFETQPGRAFRFTAKAFAASGTPYIEVYNSSNTLIVGVTASPAVLNTWQELQVTGFFPYSTLGGTATVQLRGLEASADIYWADAQLVSEMQTRLTLPTWVTAWRTEEGEAALRLYRERNRLGTIGSWPARAYDLELINDREFQIVQSPSSLNPIEIEFARPAFYTGFPLFVEARRPFSDMGTVSADTDTSACPLRLWVAAMKYLASMERKIVDRQEAWKHDYNREQWRAQSKLETPAPDSRGMRYAVLGA